MKCCKKFKAGLRIRNENRLDKNDEPWAAKYSDENFINYKTDNLAKFLKEIMKLDRLEKTINESFEIKEKVGPKSDKKLIKAIEETINLVMQVKLELQIKLMVHGLLINGLKKQSF